MQAFFRTVLPDPILPLEIVAKIELITPPCETTIIFPPPLLRSIHLIIHPGETIRLYMLRCVLPCIPTFVTGWAVNLLNSPRRNNLTEKRIIIYHKGGVSEFNTYVSNFSVVNPLFVGSSLGTTSLKLGGDVAMDTFLPFLDSSNLLESVKAIRTRAGEQGYLLIRGLLPKKAVLSTRISVLRACAKAGWIAPNTNLSDGIAVNGFCCVEAQTEFFEVYDKVQKLEDFHRLSLHPALIAVFRAIFQEDVLVHSRNICRIFFPNTQQYSTPAHQDYAQIGGTDETWTTWIPLGDCPTSLGGLSILAGSHREEVLPHHPHIGVGGKSVETEALPYQWVSGDLACGDVLMFHSHTVHKALPNLTQNQLRLSADFRYQPASHPVRDDSLEPHYGRLSWEQIYTDWDSQTEQYYWKQYKLNIVK